MTNSFAPYEGMRQGQKDDWGARFKGKIDRHKVLVSSRFTLCHYKNKIIRPLRETNKNGNATDSWRYDDKIWRYKKEKKKNNEHTCRIVSHCHI